MQAGTKGYLVGEKPKGVCGSGALWWLEDCLGPEKAADTREGGACTLGLAAMEGGREEYLAQKKLGTWSKTKSNNKRKSVKTRYVYDIKRDSEGNVTSYKAHLVAQGFNHVPGRDFDETWAPVPSSATTRAIFCGGRGQGLRSSPRGRQDGISSTPRWKRR